MVAAAGFQAALAQARLRIDEAEQIVITGSAANIQSAQLKVIDAIAALEKANIIIENTEDALDPN